MSTCSVHPLPYRANPAEYFAAIRHAPGAVLLDSGRPAAERGRYDLLSAWPEATFAVEPEERGDNFLQRLRDSLTNLGEATLPAGAELPFAGGLIGYLSYDFGRHLEHMPHLAVDDLHLPDARLGLYAWALISDHQAQTSQLVFHPTLADRERQRLIALFSRPFTASAASFTLQGPMTPDLTAEAYRQAIVRIQDYIQAGDCYQVNFAQRFRAPCAGDPWVAYCALRQACPTPFSGFQSLPDHGAVLSLSPERFVRISERHVETRPIKGTRPRGLTPQEDAAHDTRAFEAKLNTDWWPQLQQQYRDYAPQAPLDSKVLEAIHQPDAAADQLVTQWPAHLHINLLPAAQQGGWGRKLIEQLLHDLRAAGVPGVYLGVSLQNEQVCGFYQRLGFTPIVRSNAIYMGQLL